MKVYRVVPNTFSVGKRLDLNSIPGGEDLFYKMGYASFVGERGFHKYNNVFESKNSIDDGKYFFLFPEDAAKQAIQSPMLETSIEGARGIIINITGGSDMGLHEVNTAAELVQRSADPEANIIFGAVIDEAMGDELQITVIATGFEKEEDRRPGSQYENIVADAWRKRSSNTMNSNTSSSNDSNGDLDIPTFLRKNKGLGNK